MNSVKLLAFSKLKIHMVLLCMFQVCFSISAQTDTSKTSDNNFNKDLVFRLIEKSKTSEDNSFEERIAWADSALALSVQNKFDSGVAEGYYTLGKLYLDKKKYLQALDFLEKAIEIYDKNENHELKIQVIRSLGQVYYETGDFTKAIDEYFRLLRYFESENKEIEISRTYNNIGIVFHRGERDYEKALSYYNMALDVLENIPDSLTIDLTPRIYTNIGLSYFEMNEYEKAKTFFLQSIEGNRKLQNDYIQIVNEGNLALVYSGMEDYKKAETYFDRAITLSKKTANTFSLAINTAGLGKMYLEMARSDAYGNQKRKLLQRAVLNIQFALDIFKDYGDYRRYQGVSEDLANAYELLGNYNKALNIYKEHSFYKESLFNDENSKALARQEIGYEFSKRVDSIRLENEKRIAVKDAVLSANKRQKNFLIVGVLLLLIIGGLLYYQNMMRKSTNEKLSILNQELKEANRIKMQFFGIINHDLRSPISNIIKLLQLQQQPSGILDEKTQKRLQIQTLSSAENLLSSMEDLLLWSKGQMKNFNPEFKTLPIETLFKELHMFFENISSVTLEFDNPEQIYLKTDENYLITITRNLTLNAIKASEKVPNPTVSWNAYTEEKKVVLCIQDNGPWSDIEDFRALYDDRYTIGIRTGLGLHLIRDLARAINCTVEVTSGKGKGTTIYLIFNPVQNA